MTKFLSVLAGLGLMDLSLQSIDSDNNVMFLFFSANKAVAIARLVLGAFIIFIAFKGIKYRFAYRLSLAIAVLLIAFPVAGMAYPQLTYSIYNVVKPLDYLVSLAFGLILAACVLEIEPPTKRLSWQRPHLPRLHFPDMAANFIFNSLLHASPHHGRATKRARA